MAVDRVTTPFNVTSCFVLLYVTITSSNTKNCSYLIVLFEVLLYNGSLQKGSHHFNQLQNVIIIITLYM